MPVIVVMLKTRFTKQKQSFFFQASLKFIELILEYLGEVCYYLNFYCFTRGELKNDFVGDGVMRIGTGDNCV